MESAKIALLGAVASIALCSCGGGGGDGGFTGTSSGPSGGSPSGSGGNSNVWTAGVFKPSANFVAQCASPRTGTRWSRYAQTAWKNPQPVPRRCESVGSCR